jgi:hypothetical protein
LCAGHDRGPGDRHAFDINVLPRSHHVATIIIPFRVEASKLDAAKACIARFVGEIQRGERGTLVYCSYQDESDPLRFVHFMQFKNEAPASGTGTHRT